MPMNRPFLLGSRWTDSISSAEVFRDGRAELIKRALNAIESSLGTMFARFCIQSVAMRFQPLFEVRPTIPNKTAKSQALWATSGFSPFSQPSNGNAELSSRFSLRHCNQFG